MAWPDSQCISLGVNLNRVGVNLLILIMLAQKENSLSKVAVDDYFSAYHKNQPLRFKQVRKSIQARSDGKVDLLSQRSKLILRLYTGIATYLTD